MHYTPILSIKGPPRTTTDVYIFGKYDFYFIYMYGYRYIIFIRYIHMYNYVTLRKITASIHDDHRNNMMCYTIIYYNLHSGCVKFNNILFIFLNRLNAFSLCHENSFVFIFSNQLFSHLFFTVSIRTLGDYTITRTKSFYIK